MRSKCTFFHLFLLMTQLNAADNMVEKANQLFEATLYEEAATLYESICHDNMDGDLQYPFALSLYKIGDYEKAIHVLSANSESPLGDESWYLLGVCYNRIGNYSAAIEALQKYNAVIGQQNSSRAEFETSLAYFSLGTLNLALNGFKKIIYSEDAPELYYLAQIYLAQINYQENKTDEGNNILKNILHRSDLDSSLKMEANFYLGQAQFQQGNFNEALFSLEQALPKYNREKAEWCNETLYLLGNCCLKASEQELNPTAHKAELLAKAENYFRELMEREMSDRARLSLGSCFLIQAKAFNEDKYYQQSVDLLGDSDLFESRENALQGLFLLAQEATSYEERAQWYKALSQKLMTHHALFVPCWVLCAINDLDEGKRLKCGKSPQDAEPAFERTITSCKKALSAATQTNLKWEALATKTQAQAYLALEDEAHTLQALRLLENLTDKKTELLVTFEEPDEIWYLRALALAHLSKKEDKYYKEALKIAEKLIELYPQGHYAPQGYKLLGTLAYQQKDYIKAEEYFMKIVSTYPQSESVPEALYWAALSANEQNDKDKSRKLKVQLFENYPDSPLAAEAYFTCYSFAEYVQGDRAAIKHLQTFTEKYAYSPYVLSAHVLIGLDFLRDRKTPEGKWIRKKNLSSAIASFQSVMEQFEIIYQMKLIPLSQLSQFVSLRYRAMLENALANHRVSEESDGAKRQIYLEYAEKILNSMVLEFNDSQNELVKHLESPESLNNFQDETQYLLAVTYLKEGKEKEAELILSAMLKKYEAAKISRGYFLSRVLYELGCLAMKEKKYGVAIEHLMSSEEAAKGDLISIDEKLNTWIQLSHCYRDSNQLEQAMLILSRIINYDAVSGIRLHAMFLRAEIYELQSRFELARKQLEATAKKGGEWGLKAKEKLGKNYVFE